MQIKLFTMAEIKQTGKEVVEVGDGSTVNFQLPNQNISEEEKYARNGEWFWQNIQYISTFYNRPIQNIITPDLTISQTGFQQVTRMMVNMLYYLGEQPNLVYNYMTQNIDQTNLQPTWRHGQDMLPLIENIRGTMAKILNGFHFSVKPLSEKARGKYSDYYNNVMLEWSLAQKKMQMAGIQFNPSGEENIGELSEPEIKKWIDKEYKDFMAELMVNIAEGGWNVESISKFIQGGKYGVVAGWAGMEHYVDNGRHFKNILLPYQMIVDTREDDDLNRSARFAGVVTSMTPTEIFHRYPQLNDKCRKDLEEIARSTNNFGGLNKNTTNFNWWNTGVNSDATCTALRAYWISPHFLDTREVKNKYGVAQLIGSKVEWDKEKNKLKFDDDYEVDATIDNLGDYLPKSEANTLSNMNGESPVKKINSSVYIVNDVYKGTLLGNKYLLDFGLVTNVVEHPLMKYKPLLPIQVWIPNMTNNQPRSVVDRLRGIQDEIDAARFKLMELIGRAKGRIAGIKGWLFSGLDGGKEFLEDASSMGAHVFKSSGEIPSGMDANGDPVQMIDMTLDPSFMKIAEHVLGLKQEMKEIISTSTAALGQVGTYIGESTLQNSVAQSTLGQSSILDGFVDWCTTNIQMEIDIKKCLYVENPDSFDAEMMIGNEGIEFYKKVLPDLKHEDFLMRVHVRDVIDEKQRERVINYSQAYMQNIANPNALEALRNVLQLEKTKTFTEALDYFDDSIEENLRKFKKDQAEARKNEQANVAQQQQGAEVLQMKDVMAKLLIKLEEIDRKGQWDVKTALVQGGIDKQLQPVPPVSQPIQETNQILNPQQ